MGSLKRKLEDLEEQLHTEVIPAHWSYEEWPADEQLEDILDKVNFFRRTSGGTYAATDREINLLGIAAAYEELQGSGEWIAPYSGTAITLSDNGDETFDISLSSNVALEDLPEHTRSHVERLALEKQERRERWLYEDRRRSERERELRPMREAWRREHPHEKMPDYLIYGSEA
jgi:hypothetical protein